MNPFEFHTVPAMEFAWGGARRLGEVAAGRFAARYVLLVTDGGLVQAGLIDPIAGSLKGADFNVPVFTEVVADPPEAIVHRCVELGRQAGADLVIGLGGGSSLDVAKLAAVLLRGNQPLSEMYGVGKVRGTRRFLVLAATT